MNQKPKMTVVAGLMYCTTMIVLAFLTLYGLGGMQLVLNAVGLVIGIPLLGLALLATYKIGERYGWWKEGFK